MLILTPAPRKRPPAIVMNCFKGHCIVSSATDCNAVFVPRGLDETHRAMPQCAHNGDPAAAWGSAQRLLGHRGTLAM